MVAPYHKNPCPGNREVYTFGRPVLGRHYCKLSLSNLCSVIEKNIFKKYVNFKPFTPKLLLGSGG